MIANLLIRNGSLVTELRNDSSRPVRIWEEWNSWGWEVIHFEIKVPEKGEIFFIKKNPTSDWTINHPSFIEILPGKSVELKLQLSNDWIVDEKLAKVKDTPVLVKVIFQINESVEAKTNAIYTGTLESAWIKSLPPHRWLFQDS